MKILFNGEEVAEVYFEYINRHLETEDDNDECPLQFHTDLIRKSATQIIRRGRTPIWRGVKTLSFSVDKDIFQYVGLDANHKKIITVIIPFAQVNSIQTYSRKGRVSKTKSRIHTLDATTIQDLR